MGTFDSLRSNLTGSIVAAVGFLAFLAIIPFFVGFTTLFALTVALFFGVYTMTWDFSSLTGEISFGHSAFFGAGAYTTAVLNLELGLSPTISIPMGVLVAVLIGVFIGAPSLRLKGPYFSLVTLIVPLLMITIIQLESRTLGGEAGLHGMENLVTGLEPNYYLALSLFAGTLVLFYAIKRSDVGTVLTAIAEDEVVVQMSGINTVKYKLYAFLLSGAVGGLAGALFTHNMVGTAAPSTTIALSVNIIVLTAGIIGGIGTIFGPGLGGILYYMFRNTLSGSQSTILGVEVSDYSLIIFFSIAILIMYIAPEGLVPRLQQTGRRVHDVLSSR